MSAEPEAPIATVDTATAHIVPLVVVQRVDRLLSTLANALEHAYDTHQELLDFVQDCPAGLRALLAAADNGLGARILDCEWMLRPGVAPVYVDDVIQDVRAWTGEWDEMTLHAEALTRASRRPAAKATTT